jgi:hypothetical protein
MRYSELSVLRRGIDPAGRPLARPDTIGLRLDCVPFRSRHGGLLPGHESYWCAEHAVRFPPPPAVAPYPPGPAYPDSLCIEDARVPENCEFRYLLYSPASGGKAHGVIILLHGLNERTWDKYLPWAATLALRTGKAVLMFPIAFHMDRAPVEWDATRVMHRVAGMRQAHSPTIANSTLCNAAISARLESIPQRFFWSGLQTLDDLLDLIEAIRAGDHPHIAPDAEVDFFAYSIGAFLAEILLMADPEGRLAQARLLAFCGGPTLDRMYPNSRYIMDSDAAIALASFFVERLESELKAHGRLAHYFRGGHAAGRSFELMLSARKRRPEREQAFRVLGGRVRAIALQADDVVPPSDVLDTLRGGFRDIPIPVEVLHFPYPYTHMVPFPTSRVRPADVDAAFDAVFERAAAHLGFQKPR